MKKSIIEKFASFKKRHNLSNDTIQKMVTEYANSDTDLARTHFSEKYNISVNVFYKCIEYAIICCLVNQDICEKVKRKKAYNYSQNNPKKSKGRSLSNSSYLMDERQRFLNDFSDNEIKDIARKYQEGISLKNIAICYDTGEFAIKWLLKKGIVWLIVDRETTNSISSMLGSRLNNTLKKREQNKKNLINCIEKEIESLKTQIKYYELWVRNTSEKTEIETLKKNLSNAEKRKAKVLQY